MSATFILGSLGDVLERDGSKIPSEICAIAEFGKMLNRWVDRERERPDFNPVFQKSDYGMIRSSARSLHAFSLAFDLTGAAAATTRLLAALDGSGVSEDDEHVRVTRLAIVTLSQWSTDVAMRVLDELRSRSVFWVPARSTALIRQVEPLFGQVVFTAFPSANEDIAEAGMCLGLGRWTAAVMHLMRASEVGLKALAGMVGVTTQNDWGAYLRKIGEELDARAKAGGKKSADEEFYSEAAAAFDRVRRAWRNSTMHVDRSYSEERATEIYLATQSFMQHLAPRVHE